MRVQTPSDPMIRSVPATASLILSLLVGLVGCTSMGGPRAETGYRADVLLTLSDTTGAPLIEQRVLEFQHDGKRRRNAVIDGELVATIDRPDLRVSWRLDPRAKTYEEYPLSSPEAAIKSIPDPFGPYVDCVFEHVESEPSSSGATQAFAVEGDRLSGRAWFAPDRVPLRFVGEVRVGDRWLPLRVDYREVARGSQAAFLFAIPPDYADYEKRRRKSPGADESARDLENALRRLEEERRAIPRMPSLL